MQEASIKTSPLGLGSVQTGVSLVCPKPRVKMGAPQPLNHSHVSPAAAGSADSHLQMTKKPPAWMFPPQFSFSGFVALCEERSLVLSRVTFLWDPQSRSRDKCTSGIMQKAERGFGLVP